MGKEFYYIQGDLEEEIRKKNYLWLYIQLFKMVAPSC